MGMSALKKANINMVENDGDRDCYRWAVSEGLSQEVTLELSPS